MTYYLLPSEITALTRHLTSYTYIDLGNGYVLMSTPQPSARFERNVTVQPVTEPILPAQASLLASLNIRAGQMLSDVAAAARARNRGM